MMMKDYPGMSNTQSWGCPMHPQEIFKETQVSKLGDPPCIPFSINNHRFVLLHTIFLSLHGLCAIPRVSCIYFLVFFLFLLFITSWTPSYIVWERNTLHSTLVHNI